MEPRVQYAKTSDNVSIAYTVLGSGPETLICAPSIWGDLHMLRSVPLFGTWYRALAECGRRLVVYDPRNMGASEHRDMDYSEAGRRSDLKAVVSRIGVEHFDLYGFLHGCPTAVQYAVAESERVDRLVLFNPFARGVDYYSVVPEMAIVQRLGCDAPTEHGPTEDRLVYLSIANVVTGFADQALATEIADAMCASMSLEEMRAFTAATRETDITTSLSRLSVPTLVVFSDRLLQSVRPLTREVARLVPNAELVEAEGGMTVEVNRDALEAVDAFLGGGADIAMPAAETVSRGGVFRTSDAESGLTVILFADVAASTALTERMGDAAFRAKARDLDARLRNVIGENSGTPIDGKLLGDGVLATFSSASRAIAAGLACGEAGDECGLPLHLGLHAGDVIREEGDVFGGVVNIAARISDASRPGEVLVSQTVRDLARTSADVSFEDGGEHELKGVDEPLRLWRVVAA